MGKKLLLADDSITIQKVVGITFAHEDYVLTIVDNGDDALQKAQADRPDLILADVYMPGKNGYELCSAIKQDPSLAGVPVLLLAGTFEPFDEGKAKACGADAWIPKPFESQALIDQVEALLSAAPVAPAPVAPAPVAPAPVAPAPVAPAPVAPAPVAPAPVAPAPVAPAPVAPAPVAPAPVAPAPVAPAPVAPIPVPVPVPVPVPTDAPVPVPFTFPVLVPVLVPAPVPVLVPAPVPFPISVLVSVTFPVLALSLII
ncbi:MAG: response regulator [Desulfuromonadaceae bacterium]|nr:response regulator [Desulfuromonadaceae bacterium]